MTDLGWAFFGMRTNWFFAVIFIAVVVAVIAFALKRGRPIKKVDKQAGDEGED